MKHDVSDLNPCPFCGAGAIMWSWDYGTAIQCSKFDRETHLIQIRGKTSTEAIERWNARVYPPESEVNNG